ncbi:hypothetical protein BH20VER3_BH20VER3_00700 [soil metagenome]
MSEKASTLTNEQKVTLRSREAVNHARVGEIVRVMRTAAEIGQPVESEWVTELAELIGVDLRRR